VKPKYVTRSDYGFSAGQVSKGRDLVDNSAITPERRKGQESHVRVLPSAIYGLIQMNPFFSFGNLDGEDSRPVRLREIGQLPGDCFSFGMSPSSLRRGNSW
jgi:hypothetical protein